MNWDAIGAVGEAIGAIGVVATLGYLAVQIRFSAKQVHSETTQALALQMRELYVLDDRLIPWMDLWFRGNQDVTVQSNLENGFRIVFDVYESIWVALTAGAVDEAHAARLIARHLQYTLGTDFTRQLWGRMKVGYAPGFVKYIDDFQDGLPTPTTDELFAGTIDRLRKYRPQLFLESAAIGAGNEASL